MPCKHFHYIMINVLLLLCLMGMSQGGRLIPSSVPSTMRPLGSDGEQVFVKLRPNLDHLKPVFGGKEAHGCLPKGFRHSSAPSRFVNHQPLGSCSDHLP
ncbi:hypothetical protein M5689_021858 [Euphorbia peplus]|nr:hypothetical protein M5689_021858 [Euphorbia peplus]